MAMAAKRELVATERFSARIACDENSGRATVGAPPMPALSPKIAPYPAEQTCYLAAEGDIMREEQ